MTDLTLEDAEFIIKHWRLTAYHEEAAKLALYKLLGLQKETEKLLEEIERLQPPVDSRDIIPVGDHIRMRDEKDAEIRGLRQKIGELERKLAAHTLYCGKKEGGK